MNRTLTPVEGHISKAFYDNGISGWDYAMITVQENLSGYVHFDLATSYNVTATNFDGVPIYLTGCPEQVNNSSNLTKRLYCCVGEIVDDATALVSLDSNIHTLCYNMDSTSGQSGAPVYAVMSSNINGTNKRSYVALAINGNDNSLNTQNSGVMITKFQLQFYRNNPYANH